MSDTGLNPSLWGTVQQQLTGSRWLVLLACPESAASRWVSQEVDHWCAVKGVDTILLVLTGGDLTWDREAGGFGTTTALAPDVAARFTSEPLHLDLRWARGMTPPPDLRVPRFASAIARLASPIRELAPADLESEDVRLHRAARRLARGAVATLIVLALVATAAAVLAVRNAREADRRARAATARQVGLAALDLDAGHLDQALLLSLAASRLDPDADPDRFLAARTLLGRHSRLVSLLHAPADLDRPSLQRVAISPSGRRVAAAATPATGDAVTLTWDTDSGTDPDRTELRAGDLLAVRDDGTTVELSASTTLAVDAGATRAVVVEHGDVRLVDPAVEAPLAQWPDSEAIATIVDGRVAVATATTLRLVDAIDGTVLAEAAIDAVPVAVALRDDSVLTATAAGALTWWARTGDRLVAQAAPLRVESVGPVEWVVLGEDGRRALVVGSLGTVVANAPAGPVGAVTPVRGAVAVDPTGRFAAVGGARLTVWDLRSGAIVVVVADQVHAMAWSGCRSTPCRLVTVGAVLDVWEPATGRRTRLADQTNAQSVAISADGDVVVSAGWGATVAVWTLGVPIDDTGRTELAATGPPTAVDARSGALARADGDGVTVTRDGGVDRLDTGPIDELRLLAGGSRLLTVTDSRLALFDVARGAPVALAPACTGELWAVSPDGTRLVTHRRTDGRTVVCDTDDGALVAGGTMVGATRAATAVAVDDDGQVAIARGSEVAYHAVVAGGFTDGEAVTVALPGESVDVGSLAVRGGRLAATVDPTGGGAARVLLWDAATRGTAVQFESDHRELEAITLLGEAGEVVAVAGRTPSGTVVQVWEAESRRRLGLGLGGLTAPVVSLQGDTTAVIGVDTAGRAYRWALDADPRREVCAIVGRDLTPAEWPRLVDGALAPYPYAPVCAS